MKKILALVVVAGLSFALVALAACGGGAAEVGTAIDESLIGNWSGEGVELNLGSYGMLSAQAGETRVGGTWLVQHNEVIIEISAEDAPLAELGGTWRYSVSGNTLALTGDRTWTLQRVG